MIVTIPDELLKKKKLSSQQMQKEIALALYEKGTLTIEEANHLFDFPAIEVEASAEKASAVELESVLSYENQLGLQLMEEWLEEPDDKGEEWWAEFERMLYEERQKFKFRELEWPSDMS